MHRHKLNYIKLEDTILNTNISSSVGLCVCVFFCFKTFISCPEFGALISAVVGNFGEEWPYSFSFRVKTDIFSVSFFFCVVLFSHAESVELCQDMNMVRLNKGKS